MTWLLEIIVWVVALNVGGWLLHVDLTWQVVLLVVIMGVIDRLIDAVAKETT